MQSFIAKVTVGTKVFNARTKALSAKEAFQKIAIQVATKFPAQKAQIGEVFVDEPALNMLRNIFKF